MTPQTPFGAHSAAPLPLQPQRWSEAAIQWSTENSVDRPRVAALASGMGMSGHQLAKELKRHGLPPARTLLVWGRLFQAAQLLNVGKQTVETVAFTLGYANSSALRKAFQFHVGYSPSCVAREGGGRSRPGLVRYRVRSGRRFG